MEIGKVYIMQKDLCTGMGAGFEKGTLVKPIPDKETGELIRGEKDPESIFCGKAGVATLGLFVHPDWVKPASDQPA